MGLKANISGQAMDRSITKKTNPWEIIGLLLSVAAVIALIVSVMKDVSGGRSFKLDRSRIQISTVVEGAFEDFIPIRGRVTPLKTLFLDAIEGGRVERILVEDGVLLQKGDLIVELSNTSLQLEVTRNEAAVTEQLNNMRTTELSLARNQLEHKRNLVEINYQIKKLTRQIKRERELFKKGTFSKQILSDTEDDLAYFTSLREVTLESQLSDTLMQTSQLKFLKDAGESLLKNLEFAHNNLDSLHVRAPVAGKLSGFSAEVGQNIPRGNRLGQIDDPDHYKVRSNIDEFYLSRVDLGQLALFSRTGEEFLLNIAKVYPQVNNGQFAVDLVFDKIQPGGIRRGQTLQLKLTLGDANKAKLIPNGAFFQDTGGNWIFVVSTDGTQALKRSIRLGRRNARFIEVLEGLAIGEQVVTSPYTSFVEIDRLKLTSE